MRIASIDYGYNVGLSIAQVEETHDTVILHGYVCSTIEDAPSTVINLIKSSRAKRVILEKRPSQAENNLGVHSYEFFMHELMNMGFTVSKFISLQEELKLYLISPGIWKPFVRAQNVDFGSWYPETDHERDSASMIYYLVKIASKKEVCFA